MRVVPASSGRLADNLAISISENVSILFGHLNLIQDTVVQHFSVVSEAWLPWKLIAASIGLF
jgi:hypothetical protein